MSHKAKSVYNNGIFLKKNKLIPAHLGTVKITNYIMKMHPILSYLQAGKFTSQSLNQSIVHGRGQITAKRTHRSAIIYK